MVAKKNSLVRFVYCTLVFVWPMGCGGGGGGNSDTFAPVNFKTEVIVPDALFPVSIVQAANGDLFYSELYSGKIRLVVDGLLSPSPVVTLDVPGTGNEGLLGLALDPNFLENGFLYAFYTARNPVRNLVVRITVRQNRAREVVTLIDNIPHGGHDGGRLVFAEDGTIFVSVGDAGTPSLAQNGSSLAGKILRINRDGSVPSDNPRPGSPIFASGLRNPFGLSIDSRDGTLYASDNGPGCDDELNQIPAGANLGWRMDQPCSDMAEGYLQPLIRFNPPIAPTGIAFYGGKVFPQLENNLLMADFVSGHLRRFQIESGTGAIRHSESLINGEFGHLIDVAAGSDGYIYVAASSAIVRIVPE